MGAPERSHFLVVVHLRFHCSMRQAMRQGQELLRLRLKCVVYLYVQFEFYWGWDLRDDTESTPALVGPTAAFSCG